jgi:hypothetical protein
MELEHVMVDIETLGTRPGDVVASIGAVLFNPFAGVQSTKELRANGFKVTIDVCDAIRQGMAVQGETLLWWLNQSEAARQATFLDKNTRKIQSYALALFSDFFKSKPKLEPGEYDKPGTRFVWGNGANFDMTLIEAAYLKSGYKAFPWKYNKIRCFRTFKSNFLYNEDLISGNLLEHDCLEDAIFQAQTVQAICIGNPNVVFK